MLPLDARMMKWLPTTLAVFVFLSFMNDRLVAQVAIGSDSLAFQWVLKTKSRHRIPDSTVVRIWLDCKFYKELTLQDGKLSFKVHADDLAGQIFLGFNLNPAGPRRMLYSACVWEPIEKKRVVIFSGPRFQYVNCI